MAARLRLDQVAKDDECAWITERFARRLTLPLTRLALWLKLSANTVTLIAGLTWLLSLPLAPAAGLAFGRGEARIGWILLLTAALLWNLGYLLDLVDGNVARATGTACPSGFYLDYVFHLLFKPAFLASIGAFLALARAEPGWLIGAVLLIPANWSAGESAVEHVVVQTLGKSAQTLDRLSPTDRQTLLLGATDRQQPVAHKRRARLQTLRIIAQEILSYYGQFTVFSLLAAGDALIWIWWGTAFPLLRLGLAGIGLLMLCRLPWRIRREFRRARLLDG